MSHDDILLEDIHIIVCLSTAPPSVAGNKVDYAMHEGGEKKCGNHRRCVNMWVIYTIHCRLQQVASSATATQEAAENERRRQDCFH